MWQFGGDITRNYPWSVTLLSKQEALHIRIDFPNKSQVVSYVGHQQIINLSNTDDVAVYSKRHSCK